MNNRRIYRKLIKIEKQLDRLEKQLESDRQINRNIVLIVVALAIATIAVTYLVNEDYFMGLAVFLFATVLPAFRVIRQVKRWEKVVYICLVIALSGVIICKFVSLLAGGIIFAVPFGFIWVLYYRIFPKPSLFSNNYQNKV